MMNSLNSLNSNCKRNGSKNAGGPVYSATGNYSVSTYNGWTVITFLSGTGTIQFSNASSKTINCAVVGGGGSGGYPSGGGSAGGGAGGTVYKSITGLTSDTVSVTVGAGGVATSPSTANGSNSSVLFTSNTQNNLTGYGGGHGQSYPQNNVVAGSGGCGGGTACDVNFTAFNSGTTGSNLDLKNMPGSASQGYPGGYGVWGSIYNSSGGGGGMACGGYGYGTTKVGTCPLINTTPNGKATGYIPSTGHYRSDGGDGIYIPLSGFNPSIYFSGGGGGTGSYNTASYQFAGNGGKGGGGGGSKKGDTANGNGDTNGLNVGGNATLSNGGNGGANTGSGGGGTWGVPGNGGSGVVIFTISP